MIKTLKLKNYFLWQSDNGQSLILFLNRLLLHGKESRCRTRFINLLAERQMEIEKQRKEILLSHCKKVKGEPVYLDKENKETTDKEKGIKYAIQDQEAFAKELSEYLNEDFVVDVTPATSEAVYGVRDILNETKEEFSGIEAQRYFEWCEALNNIK